MEKNEENEPGQEYVESFGRPPLNDLVAEGQSGNPTARPRESKALLTIFKDALAAKMQIKSAAIKKVPRLETDFTRLATKAAGGIPKPFAT